MSSLTQELARLLQKLESKTSTPEPDFPYYVKHKVHDTILMMVESDVGYVIKPGNTEFVPGDKLKTEESLYNHPDSIIITEKQAKNSMTKKEVLAGIANVSQDMSPELREQVETILEHLDDSSKETPDWTNKTQPKYFVYLDHTSDQFAIGTSYTVQTVNTEYTLDKEYLEKLLQQKNAERATKH